MSSHPAYYIHADNSCGHFRDNAGRTLLLRGTNINARAKQPKDQPSHKLDGFWENAENGDASFVGQALDLENGEADVHLRRLREWGYNCLRYIFTWESIEHKGPGIYDEEFIEYTARVLAKCKEYGFRVVMDPHQDIFSRFSGGDGAPYWALLAAGMEPKGFTRTCAAILHCEYPDPDTPEPLSLPDVIWATGYQRLAAQTLTTLFWCGKDYAPKCIINGVNIQDYLQSHYLNAVKHLAEKLAQFDGGSLLDECIIGWDSYNEPNSGYVGTADLSNPVEENKLRVGPMPTAFQAMRLGMGQVVEVDHWKFTSTGPVKDGTVVVDPRRSSAWLSPARDKETSAKYGWKRDAGWECGQCIWALHGVWDPQSSEMLRNDYFETETGDETEYALKYWRPHWQVYARMIREAHPNAIHFIHTPVFKVPPPLAELEEVGNRAAFSTHFYDGVTLVTKHWNWFNYDAIGVLRGKYRYQWQGVKVGESAIRRVMETQLNQLKQDGQEALGNFPTFMGEIGVPFDLDDRQSYRTHNYINQTKALDASLNGCDADNVFNVTVWTYCTDNSHLRGDQWVGEDLSLWSPDDLRTPSSLASSSASIADYVNADDNKRAETPSTVSSLIKEREQDWYDGGRALPAAIRPYPIATVGVVKHLAFNLNSTMFTMDIELQPGFVSNDDLPTEIYLPKYHYAASQFVSSPYSSSSTQLTEDVRELAIDVKVSSGRWEVSGQTLKWFYERPASGSKSIKYHIEVKRIGGPIKTLEQLYGQETWSEWACDMWERARACCVVS